MGASLVIRTHPDADIATIKKYVNGVKSEMAFARGHSYSGEWNMPPGDVDFPVTSVFESETAAENYIETNHEKWSPLIAVKAIEKQSLAAEELMTDKVYQELATQRKELTSQLWGQQTEVLKRSKEAKSQYRACPGCGSKLNVQYLHRLHCPLCTHNVLWTPSDEKRKLALEKSLGKIVTALNKRAEILFKKKHPKAPITQQIWVIGGWCGH